MKPTDSVQYIKGIGEKKAKRFAKLHIHTVEDLLFHLPARYEDRSVIKTFDQIANDERVCSYGTIVNFEKSMPKRNMLIIKIVVKQGSHAAYLTTFNNEYITDKFSVGDRIAFYGKAKRVLNRLDFQSPEIEKQGEGKLTGVIFPIYPLTAGLTNTDVQKAVTQALEQVRLGLYENIPLEIREKRQLAPMEFALRNVHFPKGLEELKIARYRFVYEDFFLLQTYILMMKKLGEKQKAFELMRYEEADNFVQNLSFELTSAQKKVLEDIDRDLGRSYPMQRLVQGDVGSGKTIIAFYASYCAFLNGYQSTIMVPTEILAKQHYHSAMELFAHTPLRIRLLIGSMTKKEKEKVYQEIAAHECDLVIGTHALIQEKVVFPKLALAVTDEQHRFGVRQRSALYAGYEITPHILVLTATPIPRTLSLILQGDLDVSVINELPKGRIPIKTLVIEQKIRHKAYERCIDELQKGRQAYIVCPLVEESEELDLRSAQELWVDLKNGYLKDFRVGLIHGKLKASEKNEIMEAFEQKRLDALVSTTVIEVGINVPNATVMIVEEAQRFGLSQLHQLRGRVGRGTDESYCVLVYKGGSDILQQRMQIMSETADGFVIAEKDLQLRGPGEMFGLRQHGLPEFKVADLAKHIHIMELAQKDAFELLESKRLHQEYQSLLDKINKKFEREIQEIALN
ncbi:MAG: ATP-dependent DNA helicase RecG [Peptostreptococcaceae bacterium]|nr:ATP-dependent DNA helicase RecG [Peptostreptococcaceae bacterium]